MGVIVAELENYPNRPYGQYESVYASLLEIASSILAECQSSGKPVNLSSKLDDLARAAEALPGSATLSDFQDRDG